MALCRNNHQVFNLVIYSGFETTDIGSKSNWEGKPSSDQVRGLCLLVVSNFNKSKANGLGFNTAHFTRLSFIFVPSNVDK